MGRTTFPDNIAYGFHGTTSAAAAQILTKGFAPSAYDGDWLGSCAYFWEGDQQRAEQWAHARATRDGSPPVVIRCLIDLTDCLDLTLIGHRESLREAAREVLHEAEEAALSELRQTYYRRELDNHVINMYFGMLDASGARKYTTIRGAFQEGEPLYSVGDLKSGIRDLDHIQIGVIDDRAILEVEVRSV